MTHYMQAHQTCVAAHALHATRVGGACDGNAEMHAHLVRARRREWVETVLAFLRGFVQEEVCRAGGSAPCRRREEVCGVVDALGKVEGGECAGGACECFVADAGMWQRWWWRGIIRCWLWRQRREG